MDYSTENNRSDSKPDAEPLGGCLLAFLIVFAIIVPCIGPLVVLILSLIWGKRPGALPAMILSCLMLFLGMVLVVALPFSVAYPNYLKAKQKAREAELKSNCYTIQIALEGYAIDNLGVYPPDLKTLIESKHLYMPGNPFKENNTAMMDVPFGSSDCAGNVTYFAVKTDNIIRNYYLLGYGSNQTIDDWDVNSDGVGDKVILVLNSYDGTMKESQMPLPAELFE